MPGSTPFPATGVRLIDDLIGAAPAPDAPTTPTIRSATPYEKYVQPAVLGLRNAATKAIDTLVDPADFTSYIPSPLGMVSGPAKAVGKPIAEMAEGAVGGLKRMLRESHTIDRLADYRRTLNPHAMQAVEEFAQRNPRVFDKVAVEQLPQNITDRLGDFRPNLEGGEQVGRIRMRAPSVESGLQTLEHEARHAVDARRLGTEGFIEQMLTERSTPYLQRPMEQAALGTQFGRAAERHETQKLGRKLTARERLSVRDAEGFRQGRPPQPTLPMWTGGLPQGDLSKLGGR